MKAKIGIAVGLALMIAPAHAWGPAGHRWASSAAVELLPAEVPAFVRAPSARKAIGEFSNEPDRWRGSGKTHDSERDPGHFLDIFDDGKVMGVVPLTALPETRAEFDAQLRAGGSDQYKAGYLPYSILDGYQQLVKDFAYWRAAAAGEKRGATKADRAWFAADRALREKLTIRDLGIWSHYVADSTQPHHTTIHSDAWGPFPNPQNFPNQRGFHVRFENEFVQANVKRADVLAGAPAFSDCACPLMDRVKKYLAESQTQVEPLFALEARGMFPMPPAEPPSREGAEFATKRLSLAVGEIRDLVVLAWRESAKGGVGYPVLNVADIESGKIVPTRQMFGGE